MSGSSTETTTVPNTSSSLSSSTSANDPWKPAQESLANIINAANALGAKGTQAYTGSMVVPFSDQTMAGMDTMEGLAKGSQGAFNDALGNAVKLANGSGLTDASQTALEQMQRIASGSMLGKNPYIDDVINRSASDIVGANKMAASAAGRYGSGGYQGVTDKAVGDMASGLRYNDYQSERSKMQDAITSAFGMGQQQYANKAGASDMIANAYNNALNPAQTMMQVGSQYEDLATRQANDQYRIWQESQDAPWKTLERMSSIINPIAGMGGTQSGNTAGVNAGTTTSVAQKPSTLSKIAGGALGGLDLGFGGWGGLAGGLLGGLSD